MWYVPCHSSYPNDLSLTSKLLRNYTQNIDTLESLAGVTKVLQCHGRSARLAFFACFLTFRLLQDRLMSRGSQLLACFARVADLKRCRTRVPGQTIEPYIMSQQIPYCGPCRQQRDAELAAIKDAESTRKRDKGKGRAKGWGSGSDSADEEEADEWGGGPPGIIKVSRVWYHTLEECRTVS